MKKQESIIFHVLELANKELWKLVYLGGEKYAIKFDKKSKDYFANG